VIRNDLVEAAAWETARIRSVRVDGWHSKNCLERAFDVSVSSDGREIVLAPPNAATVLAACTSSDGDVNDRDLAIEYELEDGTRARLFVDVHHSGWLGRAGSTKPRARERTDRTSGRRPR
jgi:hypothetical protein